MPLFSSKPLRDWTLMLGMGVGGVSAFREIKSNYFSSVTTPTTEFFTAYEWLASFIDAVLAVAIGMAIFGVIPAVIRRRQRLKQADSQVIALENSRTWISIPVGVVLVACSAIFLADVEARNQMSQRFTAEQSSVLSALNRMSTVQNEAGVRLNALPGEWNKYSGIWVGLTNDDSMSAQEFLDISLQPIAAMSDIVAQMDDALVSLAGTPMSDIYEPVVVNYHDKLDAVKAYSRAIQSGDPKAVAIVIADFGKINEEAKVISCKMLATIASPPYNEILSAEDLTKLSEFLVTC